MTDVVRGAAPARAGSRPYVIGLTGPIAAGKSTIAEMLAVRGAEVIDADRVYHALLAPGGALSRRIVARFGAGIVGLDGQIDRRALGELVFRDPRALADLERLTHPAVVAAIRRRIAQSAAPVVVVEAIKLVPAGLTADIDALWLVTADPEIRLARHMPRGNLSGAEARARLAAAPEPVPAGTAVDVTIDNSRDIEATAEAVSRAWRTIDTGAGARRAQ
jgi:dephospho-CoA kinase